MYAGDKGKLTPKRTVTLNNLPPSSPTPLTNEYKFLTPLDPVLLRTRAKDFLQKANIHKESTLPSNAPMIIIGDPHLVERSGARLVVWRVLNGEIPGWHAISNPPGDLGLFDDTKTAEGLYAKGSEPVYVQSESSGQTQLDEITACVLNDAILFNSHSPGWANSLYHEIFHTFEGSKMVNSFFFKEGIVEWYSVHFALTVYEIKLEYYPPYKVAAENAEKLIRFTSVKAVAKAYFDDDEDSINQIVPLFYAPIAATLPPDERLDPACIDDAKKWGDLPRMLMPTAFKLKNKVPEIAWYAKWINEKNGGVAPAGGPALPK